MSDRSSHLSRRNFLLTVGASGAAAAAAVIGQSPPTTPRPAASTADAKRAARGYRESAHVARYYRSAKV